MIRDIILSVIMVCMLAVGVAFLSYPAVANFWNSLHSTQMIKQYDSIVSDIDDENLENVIESARKYNKKLSEKQRAGYLSEKEYEEYEGELDVTGTGILCYIVIPEIDVELPVYHGTSKAVLQKAAGHVEWSSLPAGGKNTHAVISAHCGLSSCELFTRLEELEKGDIFEIHVGENVLRYEVYQIRKVRPDDFSKLLIVKGKDLVTLVTCTPYGVNSHRLLVRGIRTEETPDSDNNVHISFDQGIFLITVLFVIFVLTFYMRNKSKVKK